jgi:hypothetical protein
MIPLLTLSWRALPMLFVLVGVRSTITMAAATIGVVIVAAAASHAKLNGESF